MTDDSRRRAHGFVLLLLVSLTATACPRSVPRPSPPPPTRSTSPSPSHSPSPVVTGYQPIEVAKNVGLAVGIDFAPDGRIFFAQVKEGAIRVIDPSAGLLPEPVAVLEVSKRGEFGLVGLALDPDFANNHRLYAYYTEPNSAGGANGNKVVRLVESANRATVEATIVGDIPPSTDKHVGGRLRFGPDRMLYVAVGDTQRPDQAQDPATPVGKVLRIGTDGSVPGDNPFAGSRTWAMGLRNPFGLAFDSSTGKLFIADNGPNSNDEINVVDKPGENFGHPVRFGPSGGRFKDPIWHSGAESNGMSGIAVIRNSLVPQLNDRVLFCTYNNGILHSLRLLPDGGVSGDEPLGVSCNLDVAQAPDGAVYLSNGSIIKLEPTTDAQR